MLDNTTYLTAIFLPPLYFLLHKRWGGASVFTCFLCFVTLPTAFLLGLGFVFWGVAAMYTVFDLHEELAVKQAELIATRTAEKIKGTEI